MAQTDTWITLAKADIQASVNDSEFEALLDTALSGGQSDPTTVLIPDVTNQVRGYIRAGSGNVLGPDGTIPSELKNAAVDLIVYRVARRISNSDTAKAWKGPADDAREMLKDVANGLIKVSAPITITTTLTSAPAPAIGEPRRHGFGYDAERGV
jgi:hypothetical protein